MKYLSLVSRFNRLKQQFDLKSRENELVQERLKQSTHHHKIEEVKHLEGEIGEACISLVLLGNPEVKHLKRIFTFMKVGTYTCLFSLLVL